MSPVDRSRLPVPGPDRPFHFPRIARRTLANGLEVRAVTHSAVPVISIVLLVPGGSSADPADRHGLVSITAGLLDEGSRGESALEVADRVARIGGDLDLEVGADAVVVSLTTLDRFFETGPRAGPRDRVGAEPGRRRLQPHPQPAAGAVAADEGSRRRDGGARVCARPLRRPSRTVTWGSAPPPR